MDKAAVLNAIRDFRAALEAQGVRPARIILYGSYARGDWKEWSDIDLVVISQDFAGKSFWQRTDLLVDAICKVRQPIEAVAMTPEEWDSGESIITRFAEGGEIAYQA